MKKDLMNLFVKIIASFVVLGLIFGCGLGNIQIKKEDMVAIDKVTIDKNVIVPEKPTVDGGNQAVALLFLGVAGSIAENHTASTAFQKYMDNHNIHIEDIVYKSFRSRVIEKKIFSLGPNSNTKLKLKINRYGFEIDGASFTHKFRRPMINVTATLVTNDSQIVWQKTDYITSLSRKTKNYTYDQLAKDPKLVENSFQQVAELVTELILADLENVDASQQAAK